MGSWARARIYMDTLFETEQLVLGENAQLLSDASLAHLRKYRYQSVDRSLLSKYVLNPFWTRCAALMPPWLAPNVITLIGIAAIVLGDLLVLLLQHGGDLATDMPRWVYFYIGIAFLFYQTMDNIDGKQARRTRTSSPLGELFDHGIDSLNCVWGAVLMCASLNMGTTYAAVIALVAPVAGMYFSTWETYFTKVLFLDYLNAPTEGLVVASMVHFLSGIFGPAPPGSRWPLLWTVPLVLSVVFLHAPSCIKNVYNVDPRTFRSTALPALIPLLVLTGSVLIWAAGPQTVLLGENGHLVLFAWALSFTFGRVSTTVILSHLCHSRFPRLSFPLVLLVLGAILYGVLPNLGIHIGGELLYLWTYFLLSAAYFFGFSALVINRLTQYLGIRAFTIA